MPEPQTESGAAAPRSISDTLTEVAADTSSLVRAEITLAGIETRDNLAAISGAVARIVIGGFLLLTAATFLTVAAVVALASFIGLLYALLLMAAILILVGLILMAGGKTAAGRQSLLPMQSLARITADIGLLQARAESIRSRGARTHG